MNFEPITQEDLAEARVALAMEILNSENAAEIVQAMHNLVMVQARRASQQKKKGKKKEAKAWKHTADEFYTVMMCAIYTKQDQQQ